MRLLLLALALSQSPKELFSASANPPRNGRLSFEVKNLVGGQRYVLTTSGKCEGASRRRRVRAQTAGPAHAEPFGLEYRIYLGRLEFNIDTETRSERFRADEGLHTLVVENRSSDVASGISCKLTSIVIRPE